MQNRNNTKRYYSGLSIFLNSEDLKKIKLTISDVPLFLFNYAKFDKKLAKKDDNLFVKCNLLLFLGQSRLQI